MFRNLSTKQSSKLVLDSEPLQQLVTKLTEQNQESISGGVGHIVTKSDLATLQRLQEEFS